MDIMQNKRGLMSLFVRLTITRPFSGSNCTGFRIPEFSVYFVVRSQRRNVQLLARLGRLVFDQGEMRMPLDLPLGPNDVIF